MADPADNVFEGLDPAKIQEFLAQAKDRLPTKHYLTLKKMADSVLQAMELADGGPITKEELRQKMQARPSGPHGK
jgi:hypothetical protein